MIHARQKPTNFTFISYSELVADHKTSLHLSFESCAFQIKKYRLCMKIFTFQELSFFILFDLIDFSGRLLCGILKNIQT